MLETRIARQQSASGRYVRWSLPFPSLVLIMSTAGNRWVRCDQASIKARRGADLPSRSVFFLSQFLTSMLWVGVAERHGRRVVLFSSLLGTAVSLSLFGTSKNLKFAIVVRLAQGLFNGSSFSCSTESKQLSNLRRSGRCCEGRSAEHRRSY